MKVDFNKLNRAFTPKVVAVVGDSKGNNFNWLKAHKLFKGKLYSVHVNPKSFEDIKALGIENYTSLVDIPEPVDLAIVAVPRNATVAVLEDCIRKGVAAAHFFSAGFSETNTEEGMTLERRLVKKAEKAGFHLVGPNCLGLFNPRVGIKQSEEQYIGVPGPLGFISQSGSIAIGFSLDAHTQGLDINKFRELRQWDCGGFPGFLGVFRPRPGNQGHRPVSGRGEERPPFFFRIEGGGRSKTGGHLERRTDRGRRAGNSLTYRVFGFLAGDMECSGQPVRSHTGS